MVGAQMLQTVQQFASHDQIEINRTAMLDGFKEVLCEVLYRLFQ